MIDTQNAKDIESLTIPKGRKGDGGTYLIVADDTDEFKSALMYGIHLAKCHRAHLGILKIIEDQDFQHWGAVEEKVKKELRDQGETYIWEIAGIVNENGGIVPSLYFAEGDVGEALVKTIDQDKNIIQLILGADKGGKHGPLVSFCTGKGLDRLRVPVVLVPEHLKDFS